MAETEAEDTEAEETDADGEEEGGEKKKKKLSGKTLILFIVLPAVLVLGGGGAAAAYFLGFFGGKDEEIVAEAEPVEELPPPVFYELPEMVVNLNTNGGRAVYLKVRVALELRTEDDPAAMLDPITPRIVDRFQVFLRQMRVEDLEGSAGMLRLKQEMIRRINLVADPLEVNDILFKELIIQ